MLVKATLLPETALTATDTSDWYDLSTATAGTAAGATVNCSAFTSGTFDCVVQTSPDQTNVFTLVTCAQVTQTGMTFDIVDGGATLPPDAMRYVRVVSTGASTPIATLKVDLWFQHD